MSQIPTPKTHYLSAYQAPEFNIESINLTFELLPNQTRVINVMDIHYLGDQQEINLSLSGENLVLLSLKLEGVTLLANEFDLTDTSLTIKTPKRDFKLEVVTEIDPENNTSLNGLYRTSGNYCTQCEAEGFRNITYYLDRPDVLSSFTTKIIANKADNSVLLSNGNLIESGDLENNQHYAIWHDPHLKPCYLFALVAGNLECVQDSFITAEGRAVDLRIYVEPQNIDKCGHAMTSLKKSMAWDEQRFGLSYDLDRYMIVAVDDFNMGAMENKGLNVFNSKFVLAKPETATDVDYEGIEAVIGHEYFHNWTGNRVTCRDWFQLTLKEGLTVFRDQEFTADMLSPAVKRIKDVKGLRNHQFPEDAGPMSHPIQPQSYIEMNNFYTMTVYEKGAEIVRLYQTLLGREGFRKGMDCYISRHDGQAVTVEDFRQAMADANLVDLSQMQNWYTQSGTPRLKVNTEFDEKSGQLTLNLGQWLKGEMTHHPLLVPVVIGFLNESGEAVFPEILKTDLGKIVKTDTGYLLTLTELQESFGFTGFQAQPVVSYLRDFSAPVILDANLSVAELSILAKYDENTFVRWESIQKLALMSLMNAVDACQSNQTMTLLPEFEAAFATILADADLNMALKSLALSLPELTYLGEQYQKIPVEAMLEAHEFTQTALAQSQEDVLVLNYQVLKTDAAYQYDKQDIAQRMLKNTCLKFLMKLPQHQYLAEEQFNQGHNMTDVLAALETLSHIQSDATEACMQSFYDQWSKDSLVMDKWFGLQAAALHASALSVVKGLVTHPDFSHTNPNRVRSVIGVFGRMNPLGFHQADGAGYRFLEEQVIIMNAINPQVAARMIGPFTHWHKLDPARQALMKSALEGILETPNLSKDVFEIASKSLNAKV